jgi:hypothetical protein
LSIYSPHFYVGQFGYKVIIISWFSHILPILETHYLESLPLMHHLYQHLSQTVAKMFNLPPGNFSNFQTFFKIMSIMAFSNCKTYKLCNSKSASYSYFLLTSTSHWSAGWLHCTHVHTNRTCW